ncbi:hypothetical protein PAXRUDRAFT_143270 [Paxillus rubicundulus Ve08.2h10]|uniref:HAT C-terminal dimerisation domain-containing protein n=1 Tax=Paxillus rubicundulus Ve08.2h10 TaxID=930991 RepID=A0A0D0DQ12_9AGAM|nr:hypothetical protein PAXRUDRAFT_143270 [Paxillus rubicundulus Ve08.2h10]
MAWGGPEEQEKEIAGGNPNPKNWYDEALKTVEKAVQEYWKEGEASNTNKTTNVVVASSASRNPAPETLESEYDCHRRPLLEQASRKPDLGWSAELRCYLNDLPDGVFKDMDVVEWWLKYCSTYLTLASIAKDICAIPTSSVPCERLFSAGAEIATDHRSCLGSKTFKGLQVMKHTWRNSIVNRAAINSQQSEEVVMEEFKELYEMDVQLAELDKIGEVDEVVELLS